MASALPRNTERDRSRQGQPGGSSETAMLSRNAAQLAVSRSTIPESSGKDAVRRQKSNTAIVRTEYPDYLHTDAASFADTAPDGRTRRQASKHDAVTDSTSIAPTSSLVDLFEQRGNRRAASPSTHKQPGLKYQGRPDIRIASPRTASRNESAHGIFSTVSNSRSQSIHDSQSPARHTFTQPKERPVLEDNAHLDSRKDAAKWSVRHGDPSDSHGKMLRPPSLDVAERSYQFGSRRGPSPSRPIPIQSQPRIDTPAADAPIVQSLTGKSITAQYNRMYAQRITPLSTGDDLANAIVASSLASSRGPSPRRLEPPSTSSRRSKHSNKPFSRTPSPVKHTMLHTLRKVNSSDLEVSDDERHPYSKHKKKRLVRKHPNKHHEGDRKRWRDAVTERERKRYDGVWAANRGLYCALVPPDRGANSTITVSNGRDELSNRVSNLVVRDIWGRSRLPDSVLETIWHLVDGDEIGRLTKDEFVVGLWLIDQRLKGRKLPVKVSSSLWTSVRSLQGIKIRS